MPTQTPRLGLKKFGGSDFFHILDWDDNFDVLDAYPGVYVCSTTTRPTTWGSEQVGQVIYEEDSKLHWVWNGSAFERMFPQGWLNGAVRLTPFATTSTAPTMVTQVSITIPDQFPANSRRYMVVVSGPSVDNDAGMSGLAIFRDTTQLQAWTEPTTPGSPVALRMTVVDFSAAAGSTYLYSIQARAVVPTGGTTSLGAGANTPITLDVIEV